MRATLHALTEELRRLKSAGVTTVSVSDESLATLRRLVRARSTGRPEKTVSTEPAQAAAGPSAPSWQPPSAGAERARQSTPGVETLPPPPSVVLPAGDKAARWAALLALVHEDPVCRDNVRPGKKVVLGVGSLDAKIFFCGEAPGAEEEVQGEPFVGPAGQLLTKMIGAMGLKREEVYIGNIMNWRPQIPTADGHEQVGNRPPSAEEMSYCLPYLRAQLEIDRKSVV